MQPDTTGENNEIRLSVIIPVFNRKPVTLQCIKQVYAHASRQVSIIVVDDGSQDGTGEEISLEYPLVHVIQGTGNWWYTKSVNEGLKYAVQHLSSNAYLLLNNDVVLSDTYIDTVIAALQQSGNEPVLFGSVSFDAENTGHPTFLGIKKFIPWRNKQYRYSYDDYLNAKREGKLFLDSVFLPGRGMFFLKSTLLLNGFLDESFPQYGSDFEFSARGQLTGIATRVCLNAVLYSMESHTSADSAKSKPGFHQFVTSLFNKYSPNYPLNNYKLIKKHSHDTFLMPVTFCIVVSGKFSAYLKYKYKLLK